MSVRRARAADVAAITAIYAQGIEDRVATFQTDVPPPRQVGTWLEGGERFPVLVHEVAGEVAGWARIVAYSPPAYYDGVGEAMLYVERAARRTGVGRRLLDALCEEAEQVGYWKLVGKVFATNRASMALLRTCGFGEVGVHRRHGRLDGRWVDVTVVERLLAEAGDDGQRP